MGREWEGVGGSGEGVGREWEGSGKGVGGSSEGVWREWGGRGASWNLKHPDLPSTLIPFHSRRSHSSISGSTSSMAMYFFPILANCILSLGFTGGGSATRSGMGGVGAVGEMRTGWKKSTNDSMIHDIIKYQIVFG